MNTNERPEAMNQPSHEPLSDQQLDKLFKAARPTPPPNWQDSFWQDLDAKLEQPARPSAHAATGAARWIKKPWVSAAAALVIILLAVPLSQKMAHEGQDQSPVLDQLAEQPAATSNRPSPPMTLGAHPAAPANNAKEAASYPAQAEAQTRQQQEVHLDAPQKAESRPESDAMPEEAKLASPLDKDSKLLDARDEAGKQKVARSNSAKNLKKDSRAKLDPMGAQIADMILPLNGSLKQLQPGHYEIRIPATNAKELEFLLDRLTEPHNKMVRSLKDHDQLVYRVEIL